MPEDAAHAFHCAGILLAAGAGTRFDPTGSRNKLLQALPDGKPVALKAADAMCAALSQVIAVLRPGSDSLAEQVAAAGCDITVCNEASSGMGVSLAHGIAQVAHADGWIIALADMPHLQPATVKQLAAALTAGAQIVAPFHKGKRGNPVGFSRAHLPALLALCGDAGARALLAANPVTAIEVDDPGVLRDIDTPQDLEL